MGHPISRLVFVVVACAFSLTAAPVAAQVCGDPDGTGTVTVTDGVQALRAAAGLSSSCTAQICDVDGSGTISVTDGVNVLRAAAGLSANITCNTEISGFVDKVETSDGTHATLEIGAAPIPGADAPTTVGDPAGNTSVVAGGSNAVTVPFDASGAAAAVAADANAVLVLALADPQGNFFDGFYTLPLAALSGQVVLNVFFPQSLGTQSFLLCPATLVNGVLSRYAVLRQDPVQVSAGTVQVTLSFQPSQDLDLHLVEPTGEEIFFGDTTSAAGGTLDLDSNPGCFIDATNNENITYPEGTTPPTGQYIVRVDYFESCDGGGVSFTLVVNNGGVRSTFSGSFSATEADQGGLGSGREIARFTFPP
jgi:hypothetical protein